MSTNQAEEAMRRAGNLESQSPKAALREYRRARGLNGRTFPDLFRTAMLFPLIATLLAYFLRPFLGTSTCLGWLLPFVLLYFVGYVPVFGVHRKIMEQTRLRYAKLYDPGRAHTVLIGSFMIMANDWLALLGIGLFGILIALPFVGIISLAGGLPLSGFDHWPRTLQYLSLGLMIFFGCSFYLTNMPLTLYFFPDSHYSGMREPFSKLRWWIQSMKTLICQVPAGWMFNRGLIQQSLANYIYTYAIARIAFDAANFSFWEGVLSGALAGIFLGQNFWKIPVDPYIEELSIAGQIRCLLRLRRWYRARENIFMLSKYSIFPPLQTCTYALGEYFFVVNPGWPREYRAEKLSNAKEIVADIGEWNYPFHSLWNESIRNIRILINESGDKIE